MPIVRLSQLSEEQVEQYKTMFNDVLLNQGFMLPAENFDENGLRFPIEYLEKVGIYAVLLPLEYMADYVDAVTKHYIDANDEEFIWHNIIDIDFDVEKNIDTINATSVGNLAYVVSHCKNQDAVKIAESHLNKIFVIAKGKTLNLLNEVL